MEDAAAAEAAPAPTATVRLNARLTAPGHDQDVRLLRFEAKGIAWRAGDVAVLHPVRPKHLLYAEYFVRPIG